MAIRQAVWQERGTFMSVHSRSCRPALLVFLQAAVLVVSCAPASDDSGEAAQQQAVSDPRGARVITEVLNDVGPVEEKVLSLAQVFAAQHYAWRPGEGVRSSAEVFMHIAAINYFFPTAAGIDPPASTGIDPADPATTFPAYESSVTEKDRVLTELRASFQHLRIAIESTRTFDLDQQVQVFGEPLSLRSLWIGHAGHLHEHLGQLIAYARVNGVAPPWSQ